MMELQTWLGARRPALEQALGALFDDAWPAAFSEPLRYPLQTGGKRVRPALVLAAYEAVGGAPLADALPAAVAVELVHTYSLVHDDLPAMDDDDERRGRPTVHVRFGEPAAILSGDALLTEAFSVLAGASLPAERRVELIRVLAEAAGYRGMVGGQAADVGLGGPVEDLVTLQRLHAGKTGALLTASAVMGGVSAGASPEDLASLERYGRAVGLAFQLADDILDADEDQQPGGPPSYVKLLGVEETRRRAQALTVEACSAIRDLPHPEILFALASFIAERDV